jgi:hypothetical protein
MLIAEYLKDEHPAFQLILSKISQGQSNNPELRSRFSNDYYSTVIQSRPVILKIDITFIRAEPISFVVV